MREYTHATALSCIDGRFILPMVFWVTDHAQVDVVDLITHPGMVKQMADEDADIVDILEKMHLSVERNKSEKIYIAAHSLCPDNPTTDESQIKDILRSLKRLRETTADHLTIHGILIRENFDVTLVD